MSGSRSLSDLLSVTTCVVLLTATGGVAAMEKMAANSLLSACKVFNTEGGDRVQGASCAAYIQGFLAGRSDVVIEVDLPSAFMQRALRTRAPGGSSRVDTIKQAAYCLPPQETLRDFAGKLVALEGTFTAEVGAEPVILQVLDRHYRCNE